MTLDFFASNRLLRGLSAADRLLLHPFLRSVDLPRGKILEAAGDCSGHAFFVEAGLIAMVARSPGRAIGIGVVGNEGMPGINLFCGVSRSINETMAQSTGKAIRISASNLRYALGQSATLQLLLLRFARTFGAPANQTALTNSQATIEGRLARWISVSHERSRTDLTVTHEFIAEMVGVRRQSVTVSLHALQSYGLIRSTRSNIKVLDRIKTHRVGRRSRLSKSGGLPATSQRF